MDKLEAIKQIIESARKAYNSLPIIPTQRCYFLADSFEKTNPPYCCAFTACYFNENPEKLEKFKNVKYDSDSKVGKIITEYISSKYNLSEEERYAFIEGFDNLTQCDHPEIYILAKEFSEEVFRNKNGTK